MKLQFDEDMKLVLDSLLCYVSITVAIVVNSNTLIHTYMHTYAKAQKSGHGLGISNAVISKLVKLTISFLQSINDIRIKFNLFFNK